MAKIQLVSHQLKIQYLTIKEGALKKSKNGSENFL